jgi:hypothetical protein
MTFFLQSWTSGNATGTQDADFVKLFALIFEHSIIFCCTPIFGADEVREKY